MWLWLLIINMSKSQSTPLLDIACFYASQSVDDPSDEVMKLVRDHLLIFIEGRSSVKQTRSYVFSLLGNHDCVDKIDAILNVENVPLPTLPEKPEAYPQSRRKAQTWSPEEDQRLLAGIHRFGLSDWAEISKFIGNGRTRSQCSQRWHRSLNPKICKERWLPSDDEKLLQLSKLYGIHSWTKVAQTLGCRTDVQCRYRYNLLTKKMAEKGDYCQVGISERSALNPIHQQRPVFIPKQEPIFKENPFSGSQFAQIYSTNHIIESTSYINSYNPRPCIHEANTRPQNEIGPIFPFTNQESFWNRMNEPVFTENHNTQAPNVPSMLDMFLMI